MCASGRSGRAQKDHLNPLVNLKMVSKCPWIQFGDVSLHYVVVTLFYVKVYCVGVIKEL